MRDRVCAPCTPQAQAVPEPRVVGSDPVATQIEEAGYSWNARVSAGLEMHQAAASATALLLEEVTYSTHGKA